MKLGKKFNTLTYQQYVFAINNHKDYSDWNNLGLYRSITENEKLSLEEQIAVRDLANEHFAKTFNFLQIKDPSTFFNLITLGKELTVADHAQYWTDIRKNQEKILKEKKINHRNFGDYSKHNCGYENCPLNGVMIRQQNVLLASCSMSFETDKNRWNKKEKVKRQKKEGRNQDYSDEIDDYFYDK